MFLWRWLLLQLLLSIYICNLDSYGHVRKQNNSIISHFHRFGYIPTVYERCYCLTVSKQVQRNNLTTGLKVVSRTFKFITTSFYKNKGSIFRIMKFLFAWIWMVILISGCSKRSMVNWQRDKLHQVQKPKRQRRSYHTELINKARNTELHEHNTLFCNMIIWSLCERYIFNTFALMTMYVKCTRMPPGWFITC